MVAASRWLSQVQHHIAIALITLTIIGVDRVTKFYIEEYLAVGESIPVLGNIFMITRVNNTGAAFGMLKGMNIVFIAAAIVVLAMFVYFYSKIVEENILIIASSLILGGTVGNLMDRLYFSYVVDYLYLSFWPTFNISDAALSIGVILLAIYLWRSSKPKQQIEIKYKSY